MSKNKNILEIRICQIAKLHLQLLHFLCLYLCNGVWICGYKQLSNVSYFRSIDLAEMQFVWQLLLV